MARIKYDMDDVTPEQWAALEADLSELERTDPAVREARRRYDSSVRSILRRMRMNEKLKREGRQQPGGPVVIPPDER